MQYYVNRCEKIDNNGCPDSRDLEIGFDEFEAENDQAAIKIFEGMLGAIELKDDQYLELAWDEETPQGEVIHIVALADKSGVEKSDLTI